jgi:hypothetical protein
MADAEDPGPVLGAAPMKTNSSPYGTTTMGRSASTPRIRPSRTPASARTPVEPLPSKHGSAANDQLTFVIGLDAHIQGNPKA